MKNIIILVLIFNFLSLNTLQSQSWYVGGVSQINKIYLPSNNINISGVILKASWSYEYGIQGAFFSDPWSYYANGMYGIRVGVLKNESFYSVTADSSNIGNLVTNNIKSIKIPVVFNSKNETSGWTYELGLMYAYNYSNNINFDMIPNKNQLSLLAALGFDWEISQTGTGLRPFTFCWGVRGSYDILSFSKNNGYADYKPMRFLNVGLYVGLNYKIDYYHDKNRYKNKIKY